MKTVRLQNNIVVEIIPSYALPVENWYGVEFAAQCVEAPDEVEQGWAYDPETSTFSAHPAPEPQIATETDLMNMAVDHEYRLALLELGV